MNLFVLRTWLEAKFAKDEKGASMVEYILLVALIALAVIAAVVFLKDQVNGKFNDAGSKLSSSGSWYIDPYSKGDFTFYTSHYKEDLKNIHDFHCDAEELPTTIARSTRS